MQQSYTLISQARFPGRKLWEEHLKDCREEDDDYLVKLTQFEIEYLKKQFTTRGLVYAEIEEWVFWETEYKYHIDFFDVYKKYFVEFEAKDTDVEGQLIKVSVVKTIDDYYWILFIEFGFWDNTAVNEILAKCDQLRGVKDFIDYEL